MDREVQANPFGGSDLRPALQNQFARNPNDKPTSCFAAAVSGFQEGVSPQQVANAREIAVKLRSELAREMRLLKPGTLLEAKTVSKLLSDNSRAGLVPTCALSLLHSTAVPKSAGIGSRTPDQALRPAGFGSRGKSLAAQHRSGPQSQSDKRR